MFVLFFQQIPVTRARNNIFRFGLKRIFHLNEIFQNNGFVGPKSLKIQYGRLFDPVFGHKIFRNKISQIPKPNLVDIYPRKLCGSQNN